MRSSLAAITGLGLAGLVRKQALSANMLALQAVEAAVQDAGLAVDDIDGLLVSRSHVSHDQELGLRLAQVAGLTDLRLLQYIDGEGTSAIQMITTAALAVNAGAARHVVCVFGDAPLRFGARGSEAFGQAKSRGGVRDLRYTAGAFGGPAVYGFAARRHMALYGSTEEDLAAVAVSTRAWAVLNPRALLRSPLSRAEYFAARYVAEPLRLLDCALPVDGAIAVVVSQAAMAPSLRHSPVHVLGFGQGHPGHPRERPFENDVHTGARQAKAQAFSMAGIALSDIGVAQLYDAFTYMTLLSLEEYGFCEKGEAGAFVRDGQTGPGGRLPTNTGGGHLSSYYLQGMTPVAEAIVQVRGHGEARQCPRHDIVLATNEGGHFDHHACLVLGAG